MNIDAGFCFYVYYPFILCLLSDSKQIGKKISPLDNWILHQEDTGLDMLWNSKTLWLNDCDSVVLVLRWVISMGSLPRTPCGTEGRPWLWLQCLLTQFLDRVLPLNHGVIIWGQKIDPCHHSTTKWNRIDCVSLWASQLSAGFPQGRAKSLGGKSSLIHGSSWEGEKKWFLHICLQRYFSGREWTAFPLPHPSTAVYHSWLIINTSKSFACTNTWIISRRANM